MGGMKDLLGGEPFDAYARHTDPETSHTAKKMGDVRLNELEMMAAKTIAAHSRGIINDELVYLTGVDWQTITPRVRPLINKGLITTHMIGKEPETRRGSKGRPQMVWHATDKLRQFLAKREKP
jgi:hypothetical protein